MNDDEKPDQTAAEMGFADPEKLKAFFEEQDAEIANLHGMFQNRRARIDALERAFLALLSALDDIHPALRSMAVDSLQNDLIRAMNPLGESEPDENDCAALADLVSKVASSGKLIDG